MIRTQALGKTFGRTVALADVDLQVARGECLALVGTNGGGRTTLLRILATLLRPSAGTLEIDGLDAIRQPHRVRSRLVYVGEETPRPEGLRVGEYLAFVTGARGPRATPGAARRVAEVLDRAKLQADIPVDALSSGVRQQLALAAALLVAPAVMLLDNPFRSLDPAARALFTNWLREHRDRGTTMVVAVNDEAAATSLGHAVARLDRGRIVSRSAARNVSAGRLHNSPELSGVEA